MAVIGNSPATTGTTVTAQSFNGDASTVDFTLSRSVNSTVDLEVLVDNVQQSPYDSSYSVSGTTLTFSEAPASGTNNIYVIYRGATIATAQVIPDDGSVSTAKLQSNAALNNLVSGGTQIGGRRNLIINGAMQVAQRGDETTGVTTTDGYYACDRWRTQTDYGTWTISQETDAPNGFSNSLKLDCTTAGTSNSDEISVRYYMEGQDAQGFGFGTADAKPLTASFWIKSNQTGTYTVRFYIEDTGTPEISRTFTIDAADTWEFKTVSVPANTSNAITNDNTFGFGLFWYFGAASGFTSTPLNKTWGSSVSANSVNSDIPGLGGSTDDYVQITGVQLEVGTVATPFEHRSYGEELALCQRYFWRNTSDGGQYQSFFSGVSESSFFSGVLQYPVAMRSAPTITWNSINAFDGSVEPSVTTSRSPVIGSQSAMVQAFTGSNTTAGRYVKIHGNSASSYIQCDAEL